MTNPYISDNPNPTLRYISPTKEGIRTKVLEFPKSVDIADVIECLNERFTESEATDAEF